jgi:uncharacterized protein (PEP-CTERM system associated)
MIPEKLHFVRAGQYTRPASLKLAFTALFFAVFAAPQAHAQAQFDSGGYNSSSTPQARAQESKLQKDRDKAQGITQPDEPEGNIPELQVFAAVSLAEVYSSNASGEANNFGGNSSGYDFYTEPGIHLGLLEQSRRLTASIHYSLTGQYHVRDHDLDQFINQLNADANAELLSQTLFLDTQAYAQPTALTRVGSLTASDDSPSNGNYRDTYGYSVRPTLMHQFGSFIETDLWAGQSGVYFVTPGGANNNPLPSFYNAPTNSNTTSIGARIASLDDFVRLKWSLNGSASNTYQANHNSQKVRSGTANASYSLTSSLSLIATGGYQIYHTSYLLNKDLDGPTILGGIQFVPSPNFYLYVQAGTQSNFPTYVGSLNWAVTPLTTITANANDQIETPQQQLLGNLQNPTGIPGANGPGGSPTSPTSPGAPPGSTANGGFPTDGLSIDNSVYRYRQFNADISRSTDRMHFDLAAFATLRERLNDVAGLSFIDKDEKNYGVRASVTRNLRRDLSGTIGLTASKANEFNGSDRLLEADIGLTYTANQTLSFYANTDILNRSSDQLIGFSNGDLTDVRVTVGVRKSF